MVIKKPDPKEIQVEINSVYKVDIPGDIQKWIDNYNSIGGEREDFIWKWLYKINCIWFYSNIDKRYKRQLVKAKFLYNMFIILLDDIAEKNGEDKLLGFLTNIPNNVVTSNFKDIRMSEEKLQYLKFSKKVWKEILSILNNFPHWENLKDVFYYDSSQFINAVNYVNLIFKRPNLINEKEFWLYLPHSMQILIDLDMDLMCNSKLVTEEIGKAREIGLTLQEMGRIGNWISTWEREVLSDDFTSIVVAHTLKRKLTNQKMLNMKDKNELIKLIKYSGAEDKFLNEWEKRYYKLSVMSQGSLLIKKNEILEKAKYLIYMHLSSKGYK